MGWVEEFMSSAVASQNANQLRDREVTEDFANKLKRVIGRPFAKLDDLDDLHPNMDPESVPRGEVAAT